MASHLALLVCTGSREMSMFQTLSSGNTVHAVPGTIGGPAAVDGTVPSSNRAAAAGTIALARTRTRMPASCHDARNERHPSNGPSSPARRLHR